MASGAKYQPTLSRWTMVLVCCGQFLEASSTSAREITRLTDNVGHSLGSSGLDFEGDHVHGGREKMFDALDQYAHNKNERVFYADVHPATLLANVLRTTGMYQHTVALGRTALLGVRPCSLMIPSFQNRGVLMPIAHIDFVSRG